MVGREAGWDEKKVSGDRSLEIVGAEWRGGIGRRIFFCCFFGGNGRGEIGIGIGIGIRAGWFLAFFSFYLFILFHETMISRNYYTFIGILVFSIQKYDL